MKYSDLHLAALTLFIASPALAGEAPAPVAQTNAVEAAATEWLAAINAGDNETGRKGFAEDAAVIGPAGPIAFGRKEIDAQVSALTRIPGFHVAFRPERSGYSNDGQIGFVVGESTISAIAAHGGREPQKQRLLLVWRKDKSGEWKCIFNVPMGAPPPMPAP